MILWMEKLMAKFKKVNPKQDFPALEKKILKFWKENKTFEKSLQGSKSKDKFVFYEGPPTANGRPGIHHVLARAYKDIILRYKTMKGFYVGRRAGWDTHGLPVEIQVEKELGLKSKKDVEDYGIEKFNKKCKESVWRYKADWEDMTNRMGFWIDMSDPYITYKNDYIEAVWGLLKKIWDKGLIYKGYKSVPWCPRCGTALSSHEVAQGYKNVEDESVYVKFKISGEDDRYLLVWTTTPWTLPGNIALAVGEDVDYVEVEENKEKYILAKNLVEEILGKDAKIIKEFKGQELIGQKYKPLFDNTKYIKKKGKADFQIWGADFVVTDEGTGIVHIAPAFGEDDLNLQKEKGFSVPVTMDPDGSMLYDIGLGKFVKDADSDIKKDLNERKLLFREGKIKHEYPFCWRCDSHLIYFARSSWFIEMSKLRQELKDNNEKIKWIPEYIKNGRFGEWLEDVKDWALSRERYWGTPFPVWECDCGEKTMIGSVKELEKLSGKDLKDLDFHRPFIDEIKIKCPKCGKDAKRVPELIDVWFDAGSMPFASNEYPKNYPADYIAEAIDQTRGWFYTLLAISTLLDKGTSYKNVICLGHVLDEHGKKMSKSKGNIIDPWKMMDKFGADSVRWLFYTINGPGDTKKIGEKNIQESLRKFILLYWNIYSFFVTYANTDNWSSKKMVDSDEIMDRWIDSRINNLIVDVEGIDLKDGKIVGGLEKFNIVKSARRIQLVVNEFSTWYLRRSRKRRDAKFYSTMYRNLLLLSKIIAPFTPFISEKIYQGLKTNKDPKSVHLCKWPKADEEKIDKNLINKMRDVKKIVELGHAIRAENGIKVRQPLATVSFNKDLDKDLIKVVLDELNIKEFKEKLAGKEKSERNIKVILDTKITLDLEIEGIARDVIREIQQARKEAGLSPDDKIKLYYQTSNKVSEAINKFSKGIQEGTNSIELIDLPAGRQDQRGEIDYSKDAKIGKENLWIGIKN